MNTPKIIEQNGVRILTTAQLAESYGADNRRISENFNRNKNRFTEGKHFIALTNEGKREFLNRTQIEDGSKNASVLYLWTEKGAWLHAKSLNTDAAWDAYEMLVDDYYKIQQQQIPLTIEDMIMLQAESVKQLKGTVENHSHQLSQIKLVVDNEIWITEHQKSELRDAVSKRVYQLHDEGYDHAHFQTIYGALKRHFGVAKYDKIPRKHYQIALNFVNGFYPPRLQKEMDL